MEAHGTGTVAGDRTVAQALGRVFGAAGGGPRSVALGSVKSIIARTKCAAGLAGLIKAAFARHHKVQPPTLAETPNPNAGLRDGPLYLNTAPRPWVHGADLPRTAGVSAFGFGGTNFHAVLEEDAGDHLDRPAGGLPDWPTELVVGRRTDVPSLVAAVRHTRAALAAGPAPPLADLAASAWAASRDGGGRPTLCVVAGSLADLRAPAGLVVITDDGRGVGRGLAARLAELDVPAVLIGHAAKPDGGGYAADLLDPSSVADLLARVRARCGPAAGLIRLLPLAGDPSGRARRDVRPLYLVAKGLEADVRGAAGGGPAVLLAATALGGRMGYGGDLPAGLPAGHGGVAGFTKCLGREWPEVTVRAVDLDPAAPAASSADQLLAELGDPDGPFETGRAGDRRTTWQVEPGPLDSSSPCSRRSPVGTATAANRTTRRATRC